jgi:hypothetical protein
MWVGIGCGAIVLVAVIAVGAITYFTVSTVKDIQEQLTDPGSREEKALSLLGADELPDGYHAMMSFSIPFVFDAVLLTDRAPDPDGEIHSFGERGFIYVKSLQGADDRQRLLDVFEGNAELEDVLAEAGIRFQHSEIGLRQEEEIVRSVWEREDVTIRYVASRGEVLVDGAWKAGLNTLMLAECPDGDRKVRLGIWFAPTPEPGEDGTFDYAGTPADETVIRDFVGHFRPCD